MSLDFYDQAGTATAYTEDGEHLYSYDGHALGYFNNGNVYSYAGRHLGTFDDGLIRDHEGSTFLFSTNSTGGPMRPVRQMLPMKGMKEMRPIKSIREMTPMRPMKTLSWSRFTPQQFFLL